VNINCFSPIDFSIRCLELPKRPDTVLQARIQGAKNFETTEIEAQTEQVATRFVDEEREQVTFPKRVSQLHLVKETTRINLLYVDQ
jgi:hypothetical protein